jgi:hypothetical protein
VSEQRRAGVLLAADGALPKDNARGQYMNTDNGAVRSSFAIVRAASEGERVLGTRASGSGRRRTRRVRMGGGRLWRDEGE